MASDPIQWGNAWSFGQHVLQDAQLDSLANGNRTTVGLAFNNSSTLAQYGILRCTLTFGSAPSSGGSVWIYMIQQVDGSNYADGSDTVDPGVQNIIAFVPVKAVTTQQIVDSPIFA